MKKDIIKILVLIAFLVMVTINFLANFLPINNMTSGQISDSYPNLFAPAGIAFSIWGLIYLLLGAYVLYQLGLFKKVKDRDTLLNKIGIYFIISSLANISWIFSWHYNLIFLSLLFITVMLFSLIKIALLLKRVKLSSKEYFFIRLPFSIYFGWITIATIANLTVFLVSLNWKGFGIANNLWMILVLFIGTTIGIIRMHKDKDLAYGLVFIWAYSGILIKHISQRGFGGQYLDIIIASSICIFLFLIFGISLIKKKIPKEN